MASGSAAAALKKSSDESGAGRFTDFNLPPLLFFEYIHLKKYEHLMRQKKVEWEGIESDVYSTIDIDRLNELFLDYINYGGYPEVAFPHAYKKTQGNLCVTTL